MLSEELVIVRDWLRELSGLDLEDVVADSGITAGMVVQHEARGMAARLDRALDAAREEGRQSPRPLPVGVEEARPMAAAPKTGELVWLLMEYGPKGADHPLVDARRAWTLGFNNLANTDEDRWQLVGWCWSHDHFTETSAEPLAWKPIGFDLEADDVG